MGVKNKPAKFIATLFEILKNNQYKQCIHWQNCGHAFVIPRIKEFSQSIMAQHFSMRNFQSFLRQLSHYRFKMKKNELNQKEYSHKYFVQDDPSKLYLIQRKSQFQQDDSPSRQNVQLKQQFDSLKEQQLLLSYQLRVQFQIQTQIAGQINQLVNQYTNKYLHNSPHPYMVTMNNFYTILQGYKPDAGSILAKPLQELFGPCTPIHTPKQFI